MNKKIHDKILKYLYDYGEYLYILQETFLCTLYETMATFPLLRDKSVVPVLLRKKNHTKKIIPKKSCENNASSEKK